MRTGSNNSSRSSDTIRVTEVASSSCRLITWSCTLTLMLLMSRLDKKCLLDTHWSKISLFGLLPTFSRISAH